MRCSLGYALHDQDEVAKCLEVEGPAECWKTAHNWRVAPAESPRMAEQTRKQIAAITHSGEPEEEMPAPHPETSSEPATVSEIVDVIDVTQLRVAGDGDGTD